MLDVLSWSITVVLYIYLAFLIGFATVAVLIYASVFFVRFSYWLHPPTDAQPPAD